MFNPKAYLEQLLVKSLSEWVENFDGSSLNIGFLESDVNLSNLVLKPKSIPIGNHKFLDLEYGRIDSVNLQIPWSTIRVGGLNVTASDVSLIFRVRHFDGNLASDGDDGYHDADEDSSVKSQNKSIGADASWASKTLESFATSWLTGLLSRFKLAINNVQISILIPRNKLRLSDPDDEHDHVLLQTNIASISINNDFDVSSKSSMFALINPPTKESPESRRSASFEGSSHHQNISASGVSDHAARSSHTHSSQTVDSSQLLQQSSSSATATGLQSAATASIPSGVSDSQFIKSFDIRGFSISISQSSCPEDRTEFVEMATDTDISSTEVILNPMHIQLDVQANSVESFLQAINGTAGPMEPTSPSSPPGDGQNLSNTEGYETNEEDIDDDQTNNDADEDDEQHSRDGDYYSHEERHHHSLRSHRTSSSGGKMRWRPKLPSLFIIASIDNVEITPQLHHIELILSIDPSILQLGEGEDEATTTSAPTTVPSSSEYIPFYRYCRMRLSILRLAVTILESTDHLTSWDSLGNTRKATPASMSAPPSTPMTSSTGRNVQILRLFTIVTYGISGLYDGTASSREAGQQASGFDVLQFLVSGIKAFGIDGVDILSCGKELPDDEHSTENESSSSSYASSSTSSASTNKHMANSGSSRELAFKVEYGLRQIGLSDKRDEKLMMNIVLNTVQVCWHAKTFLFLRDWLSKDRKGLESANLMGKKDVSSAGRCDSETDGLSTNRPEDRRSSLLRLASLPLPLDATCKGLVFYFPRDAHVTSSISYTTGGYNGKANLQTPGSFGSTGTHYHTAGARIPPSVGSKLPNRTSRKWSTGGDADPIAIKEVREYLVIIIGQLQLLGSHSRKMGREKVVRSRSRSRSRSQTVGFNDPHTEKRMRDLHGIEVDLNESLFKDLKTSEDLEADEEDQPYVKVLHGIVKSYSAQLDRLSSAAFQHERPRRASSSENVTKYHNSPSRIFHAMDNGFSEWMQSSHESADAVLTKLQALETSTYHHNVDIYRAVKKRWRTSEPSSRTEAPRVPPSSDTSLLFNLHGLEISLLQLTSDAPLRDHTSSSSSTGTRTKSKFVSLFSDKDIWSDFTWKRITQSYWRISALVTFPLDPHRLQPDTLQNAARIDTYASSLDVIIGAKDVIAVLDCAHGVVSLIRPLQNQIETTRQQLPSHPMVNIRNHRDLNYSKICLSSIHLSIDAISVLVLVDSVVKPNPKFASITAASPARRQQQATTQEGDHSDRDSVRDLKADILSNILTTLVEAITCTHRSQSTMDLSSVHYRACYKLTLWKLGNLVSIMDRVFIETILLPDLISSMGNISLDNSQPVSSLSRAIERLLQRTVEKLLPMVRIVDLRTLAADCGSPLIHFNVCSIRIHRTDFCYDYKASLHLGTISVMDGDYSPILDVNAARTGTDHSTTPSSPSEWTYPNHETDQTHSLFHGHSRKLKPTQYTRSPLNPRKDKRRSRRKPKPTVPSYQNPVKDIYGFLNDDWDGIDSESGGLTIKYHETDAGYSVFDHVSFVTESLAASAKQNGFGGTGMLPNVPWDWLQIEQLGIDKFVEPLRRKGSFVCAVRVINCCVLSSDLVSLLDQLLRSYTVSLYHWKKLKLIQYEIDARLANNFNSQPVAAVGGNKKAVTSINTNINRKPPSANYNNSSNSKLAGASAAEFRTPKIVSAGVSLSYSRVNSSGVPLVDISSVRKQHKDHDDMYIANIMKTTAANDALNARVPMIYETIDYEFHLQLDRLEVLLGVDARSLLCQLDLADVSVVGNEQEVRTAKVDSQHFNYVGYQATADVHRDRLQIQITSMSLLDLTDMGSTHAQVLWGSYLLSEPMITIDFDLRNMTKSSKSPECEDILEMLVDIRGTRVCLLYRFYLEMFSFIADECGIQFTSMVKAALDPLSCEVANVADELNDEHGDRIRQQAAAEELERTVDESSDSTSSDDDDDIIYVQTTSKIKAAAPLRSVPQGLGSVPLGANESEMRGSLNESGAAKSIPVRLGNSVNWKSSASTNPKTQHVPFDATAPGESTTTDDQKKKSLFSVKWCFRLHDFVLVLPRNSITDDLVALTVGKASICNMQVRQTWDDKIIQNGVDVAHLSDPIHFDLKNNTWFIPQTLPSSLVGKDPTDQQSPPVSIAASDAHSDEASILTMELSISQQKDEDLYDGILNHVPIFASTSLVKENNFQMVDEDDDEQFFDAIGSIPLKSSLEKPITVATQPSMSNRPNLFDTNDVLPNPNFHWVSKSFGSHDQSLVNRWSITLTDVVLYMAVGTSFDHLHENAYSNDVGKEDEIAFRDSRMFYEIENGGPVYGFLASDKTPARDHTRRRRGSMSHYKQTSFRQQLNSLTWLNVTAKPSFHVQVVIDFIFDPQSTSSVGKDDSWKMRVMITDTPQLSNVHLNVSTAEFYLLLSIFYDNFYELSQPLKATTISFEGEHASTSSSSPLPGRASHRTAHESSSQPANDSNGSGPSKPKPPSWHQYGTKRYLEKLMLYRKYINEIVIVRAEIQLDCSMDLDYFSIDSPALQYLKNHYEPHSHETARAHESDIFRKIRFNGGRTALPLGSVYLSGLSVHVRWDRDVFHVAVGAGAGEIADLRDHMTSYGKFKPPLVLRVPSLAKDKVSSTASVLSPKQPGASAHSTNVNKGKSSSQEHPQCYRRYGGVDFNYGLNLTPFSVVNLAAESMSGQNASAVGQPTDKLFTAIKVLSVRSLTTNWQTNNIGLHLADLSLSNVDFIWLIMDYFSVYFSIPAFGHPGALAYSRIPPADIPYCGKDVRLFVTRPHICVIEEPLVSNPQAQSLIIESDRGLFYRYIADHPHGSVKMDLRVFDIAAILMRTYRAPVLARCLRGAAGSGRGVRTLVEFFNCNYSYHFDKLASQLDMALELFRSPTPTISSSAGSHIDGNTTNNRAGSTVTRSDDHHLPSTLDFVNLDAEEFQLKPATISHPRTVFPLTSAATAAEYHGSNLNNVSAAFPLDSCNVVISYEDLLFLNHVVNSFLFDELAQSRPTNDATAKNIFTLISLSGLRVVVVDNVLGLHLPLAQLFLHNLQVSMDTSQHGKIVNILNDQDAELGRAYEELLKVATTPLSKTMNMLGGNSLNKAGNNSTWMRLLNPFRKHEGEPAKPDVMTMPPSVVDDIDVSRDTAYPTIAHGLITVWADYFNNIKKCWEPLLERLDASCTYEQNSLRAVGGVGFTLRTSSAVHVNISGALYRAIGDTLNMIHSTSHSTDGSSEAHPQTANESSNGHRGAGTNNSRKGILKAKKQIHKKAMNHGLSLIVDGDELEEEILESDVVQVISSKSSTASRSEKNSSNNSEKRYRTSKTGIRPFDQSRSASTSGLTDLYGIRRGSNNAYVKKTRRASTIHQVMESHEHSDDVVAPGDHNHEESLIVHSGSRLLNESVRVGFSIQNLLGQPVRYLQQWAEGKRAIQYIEHGERGLLNFTASTTVIRNMVQIEEAFNVQLKYGQTENVSNRSKTKRLRVGHEVAVQVAGFDWLKEVQADVLSVKYHNLKAIKGRRNAIINDETSSSGHNLHRWKIDNALKLVAEVTPNNGGRMLRLRSCFTVKNNTNHVIQLMASDAIDHLTGLQDEPFELAAGESFYVPIALLHRAATYSNLASLGGLFFRPADVKSVEEELGARQQGQLDFVDFSFDPLNLLSVVERTAELLAPFPIEPGTKIHGKDLVDNQMTQLWCYMHAKSRRGNAAAAAAVAGSPPTNTHRMSAPMDQNHRSLQHGNSYHVSSAGSGKLPPYCYNIEVQRVGTLLDDKRDPNRAVQHLQAAITGRFFQNREIFGDRRHDPIHYNIVIHPPIILENLLPTGGVFEIVHATQQKRIMWSSWIGPGEVMPIHTVTLEEPLLLLVHLKYCRSPDGVLIHRPVDKSDGSGGIADTIQRTLEGLLDEGDHDHGDSILLTDTVGQRIMLSVENIKGKGGQRQIIVFCPYWIINNTQFSLRIREEGSHVLPAGTVTVQKDGSKPVAAASSSAYASNWDNSDDSDSAEDIPLAAASHSNLNATTFPPTPNARRLSVRKRGSNVTFAPGDIHIGGTTGANNTGAVPANILPTGKKKAVDLHSLIFPGTKGPLHSSHAQEFECESQYQQLLGELSFEEITSMAYMFSFNDDTRLLLQRRVAFQIDDSDWSRAFSLDSVGVNQVVPVDEYQYGMLEVGFRINSAPGRLAKYTKIVRFLPKFVAVNRTKHRLQLHQPMGLGTADVHIDVSPNHMRPFHLPALFGERQLMIELEGAWQRTVAFNLDQIGVYTLRVKRHIDLASLRHVNTRIAPEYNMFFPPKEIGIWFETDWGESNIVVKSFKPGSYAATSTEIQVGDVLLAIDGNPVPEKFELAMTLLRGRMQTGGCHVTLRTVEEKLRLIRQRALRSKNKDEGPAPPSLFSPGPQSRQSFHPHEDFRTDSTEENVTTIKESISQSYSSPAGTPDGGRNRGRAGSIGQLTNLAVSFNEDALPADGDDLLDNKYDPLWLEHLPQLANLHEQRERSNNKDLALRIDIRQAESCSLVIIHEIDPHKDAEYIIENQSVSHMIYYKQKGIQGNMWSILWPRQTARFIWEDPFKSRKLLVKAGHNVLCPLSTDDALFKASKAVKSSISYLTGTQADSSIVEIMFDEIGNHKSIPLPRTEQARLMTDVRSQGPSKALVISSDVATFKEEISYSTSFLREQIKEVDKFRWMLVDLLQAGRGISEGVNEMIKLNLEDHRSRLVEFQSTLMTVINGFEFTGTGIERDSLQGPASGASGDNPSKNASTFAAYTPFDSFLGRHIVQTHQLVIDVLEAKELFSFVAGKTEDVYVKVFFKNPHALLRNKHYSTYVCEKTLNPQWINQRFIFDLPEIATTETREFVLRVVVIAHDLIRRHRVIGKADIHLSCLKGEKVVKGWFPFRPAKSTTRINQSRTAAGSMASMSDDGSSFATETGSVKLQLQWVHSPRGLVEHVVDTCTRRLNILQENYAVQHILKAEMKLGGNDINTQPENTGDGQLLTLGRLNRALQPLTLALSHTASDSISIVNHVAQSTAKLTTEFMRRMVNPSLAHTTLSEEITEDHPESPKPLVHRVSDSPGEHLSILTSLDEADESAPLVMDSIHPEIRPRALTAAEPEYIADPHIVDHSESGSEHSESGEGHHRSRRPSVTRSRPVSISLPRDKQRTVRRSTHESLISNWRLAAGNIPSHSYDGNKTTAAIGMENMRRHQVVEDDNAAFLKRCHEECYRSFKHIQLSTGTLKITPMQALYLPDQKRHVSVRVSYGDDTHNTHSIPPAADLSWYQEPKVDANAFYFSRTKTTTHTSEATDTLESTTLSNTNAATAGTNAATGNPGAPTLPVAAAAGPTMSRNDSLTKAFKIDTVNLQGSIRIRIVTDDFPIQSEVARLDISVLNLLDSLCMLRENEVFDRWFPLLLYAEGLPTEGEMGNITQKLVPEREKFDKFGHRRPCIRLRFTWTNDFPTSLSAMDVMRYYLKLQLPSLSISVIDSNYSRELFHVGINEVDVRRSVTRRYTDTRVNVVWMQVDNQLPDAEETVIAIPTPVRVRQPVVRLSMRKNNMLSTPHLSSYDNMDLVVQQLDIRLEQSVVVASWEHYQQFMLELRSSAFKHMASYVDASFDSGADKRGYKKGSRSENDNGDETAPSIFDVEADNGNKIYVELLFIGPIKLNVSFITTQRFLTATNAIVDSQATAITTSDLGILSRLATFVRQVVDVVVNLTSSITDAPINIAGHRLPYVLKTSNELSRTLLDHYLISGLGQLYKIVGSLDLVGNPVGLLNSLSIGVNDFFFEPANALINHPKDFGIIGRTVVKGAISIVSNTTDGFIGTGTTITRSVGRSVAQLTMDPAFIRSRETLQRAPIGVMEAFKRPFKDVGNGFYYGVVGLVKVPYNNTKRFGATGLVSGVAQGLAGLGTKPVVGVLDAITHTGDAFRAVVKASTRDTRNKPLYRLRLSNLFGPDGRIMEYNMKNALGTYVLRYILHTTSADRMGVSGALHDSMGMLSHIQKMMHRSKRASYLASDTSLHSQSMDSITGAGGIGSIGSMDATDDVPINTSSQSGYLKRGSASSSIHAGSVASGQSTAGDPFTRSHSPSSTGLNGLETGEVVIYTAIINENASVDTIVVLSSLRVVVAHYLRHHNVSTIKELWRCKLSDLNTPVYDHRGGYVTVTLTSSLDDRRVLGLQPNTSARLDRAKRTGSGRFFNMMNNSHDRVDGAKPFSLTGPGSSGKATGRFLQRNGGVGVQSTNQLIETRNRYGLPFTGKNNPFGRGGSDQSVSTFSIMADYQYEDIMCILYNCILTITGSSEDFKFTSTYNTEFEEDDMGIIHIGPWQFTAPGASDGLLGMKGEAADDERLLSQELFKEIETTDWLIAPKWTQLTNRGQVSLTPGKQPTNLPLWLVDECKKAIHAHKQLKAIEELLNHPQGGAKYKQFANSLRRGSISLEEYKELVHSHEKLTAEDPTVHNLLDQSLSTSLSSRSSPEPAANNDVKDNKDRLTHRTRLNSVLMTLGLMNSSSTHNHNTTATATHPRSEVSSPLEATMHPLLKPRHQQSQSPPVTASMDAHTTHSTNPDISPFSEDGTGGLTRSPSKASLLLKLFGNHGDPDKDGDDGSVHSGTFFMASRSRKRLSINYSNRSDSPSPMPSSAPLNAVDPLNASSKSNASDEVSNIEPFSISPNVSTRRGSDSFSRRKKSANAMSSNSSALIEEDKAIDASEIIMEVESIRPPAPVISPAGAADNDYNSLNHTPLTTGPADRLSSSDARVNSNDTKMTNASTDSTALVAVMSRLDRLEHLLLASLEAGNRSSAASTAGDQSRLSMSMSGDGWSTAHPSVSPNAKFASVESDDLSDAVPAAEMESAIRGIQTNLVKELDAIKASLEFKDMDDTK